MGIDPNSANGRVIQQWLADGRAVDTGGKPAPVAPPAGPPARRGRTEKAELVKADFRRPRRGGRWAEWDIPLRLDPTTNGGAVKRWLVGIAGKHRRAVGAALADGLGALQALKGHIDRGGRVRCTITRLGGGLMDDDNLQPTGKWVRDTVALFLGCGDGPRGPIGWEYDQEPGGPWGVRVRLEAC